MPTPRSSEPPTRIRINLVQPTIDGGRYAPKRCVGDTVTVSADIFGDGHEILRAVARYRPSGGRRRLQTQVQAGGPRHKRAGRGGPLPGPPPRRRGGGV